MQNIAAEELSFDFFCEHGSFVWLTLQDQGVHHSEFYGAVLEFVGYDRGCSYWIIDQISE